LYENFLQLGVYLPERRKPLGIYIPRPVNPDAATTTEKSRPLPSRARPKRPRQKPEALKSRQDPDLPTFAVKPVNPDSAIGKLFRLGQVSISLILLSAENI
jgi:hypothetical protein